MPRLTVDLRSDTVTRPTPAMREAMARAEVGDDVIDRDPTTARLEARLAELLGYEAALFMPSGTMTNQVAVRLHCRPGDELVCDARCHIYNYEQGGFAQLSGVATRAIAGEGGMIERDALLRSIRREDVHQVRTRLVCLENTHNMAGGRVLPLAAVADTCAAAAERGLRRHLDGARLFNAVAASGVAAREWAAHFDTVSICFSKGLGAPVGSALAGSAAAMREANRHRKLFGGGMRQSGVIAAGALHALEHHLPLLAEDHRRARELAEAIAAVPFLELEPAEVETNIVLFRVDERKVTAEALVARMAEAGIHMLSLGPGQIRAVTHLDFDDEALAYCVDFFADLARR